MTKQQEVDLMKMMASTLKWMIGIAITISLFVIGESLYNARRDGNVQSDIETIKEDIREIKEDVKRDVSDVRQSNEADIREIKTLLKETSEDINNIEFFLAAQGYKAIQRTADNGGD